MKYYPTHLRQVSADMSYNLDEESVEKDRPNEIALEGLKVRNWIKENVSKEYEKYR